MTILICDDSNEDALQLKKIVEELSPGAHPVVFNTGRETLDYISSGKTPELCFLDIIMPEMDGVSLAQNMRKNGYKGHIVFLTASNDYAAQAFDVKAFSYLLKPLETKKVADLLYGFESARKTADTGGIPVKTKKLSMFLFFKDISHAEVIKRKVCYRLINGDNIEVNAKLGDITPLLLTDRRFAQCHNSFVVNMDDVFKIQGNNVIMKRGENISISRTYAGFKNRYINYVVGKE
jgi:DNA-binding LytR/AlgR family response regulator